jgi:hypothetical protein
MLGQPHAAAVVAAVVAARAGGKLVSIYSWAAVAQKDGHIYYLLHPLKIREMDGALALGGHHLLSSNMTTHSPSKLTASAAG